MPESKVESVKIAEEARFIEEADLAVGQAKMPPVRHRTRLPRASDLLIGDYTSQTGHQMKVERRENGGRYAFTVKDGSDAVVLQTTARNFMDMSMTIEVWQMSRVDPSADPSTEETR